MKSGAAMTGSARRVAQDRGQGHAGLHSDESLGSSSVEERRDDGTDDDARGPGPRARPAARSGDDRDGAAAAGPGEIAIDVHAAGVNFPDALMVAGKYQVKPPLPFTLGVEVAGTVRALGDGVAGLRVGDRVAALPKGGGFADVALANAAGAIAAARRARLRDRGRDADDLRHRLPRPGRPRPAAGRRAARVTGAGGGVGTAAVDIGRALGAHVVAIVGSEQKRATALAAGAHEVVLAGEPLPKGDLLLDNVGGDVFDRRLRALDWNGRALVVGFASGTIPEVAANRLLLKELELIGVYWGTWAEREPGRNRANFARHVRADRGRPAAPDRARALRLRRHAAGGRGHGRAAAGRQGGRGRARGGA